MARQRQNAVGLLALTAVAAAVVYGLYFHAPPGAGDAAGTVASAAAPAVAPAMPLPVAANVAVAPSASGATAPADALTDAPASDVAPNYIGPRLQIYEAHWQGMDTMQFTEEVRKKLKYPGGFDGILIGEVTLAAGRSGLLAGDVLVAVEGVPIASLEEFQRQTKALRNERKATVTVMRKGKLQENGRYAMHRRSFVLQADDVLGFAQVEAAPMIVAGDPAPHGYRGPCTDCHAIGEGWELAPDPDLINLPPPKITQAAVARGEHPHRDFGPCQACHVIVP